MTNTNKAGLLALGLLILGVAGAVWIAVHMPPSKTEGGPVSLDEIVAGELQVTISSLPGDVTVHAIQHATLADLREALIASQSILDSTTASMCPVGVLGYIDANGDAQALTAADVEAMKR